MAAYNDWPEDFPPVTSLVPYSALRHNSDPEIAALYDRAKNHEDTIAAAELINKLFINEGAETVRQKIESLSVRNPNAIIAYVHAIEGQGKNKIPAALTKFINEISGLEIEDSIVQADIVSKTGVKNTWYRMAHRPSFYGQVQSGREYILVDDVFSAGGTLSELRAYIESNGGKVVNAVTMANGSKSMNPQLGVTKQHILELENKYGVVSVQQFLQEESLYAGNYKALTDSEARTILGAATLDEARNRILAARQEGIVKNSRGMVQSPSLPDEVETSFQVESIQHFLQEESLYAGNYKALTDSEARTILGAATLDEARNRIAAARQEGIRRNRPEVVQGTSLSGEVENPQNTALNRNSTNTILSSPHEQSPAGELFSGNRRQTMPDIINDYLEKNSIREDDGTVKVNNLSGLNRQLNAEKPFFGDIMKFTFENDRLPTDAEIAQMPRQGWTQEQIDAWHKINPQEETIELDKVLIQRANDSSNAFDMGSSIAQQYTKNIEEIKSMNSVQDKDAVLKKLYELTTAELASRGNAVGAYVYGPARLNKNDDKNFNKAARDATNVDAYMKSLREAESKMKTQSRKDDLVAKIREAEAQGLTEITVDGKTFYKLRKNWTTKSPEKTHSKEHSMADEFNPKQQTETDLMNEYKDYTLEEIKGRGLPISSKEQAMSDTQQTTESLMSSLWMVRYQIDFEKKEHSSDMNSVRFFTDDGRPETKHERLGDSILRYTEYFERTEEPIAYRKMQFFDSIGYDGALTAPFMRNGMTSKEQAIADEKFDLQLDQIWDVFQRKRSVGLHDIEGFLSQIQMQKQQENKQANPASLEAANNTKEHSMSDVQNETRDPKQEAFINALYQRKVVTNALKDGKLSCLPGADGIADTAPAVNLVNGTYYHGANMLFLKEIAKENGFPTAEYVTASQMEKAHKDDPTIAIRKGEHGVSIYVHEQNESGEWDIKSIRLFNAAQTTKPWELKKWAEQEQQKEVQEKIEFLKSQYGTNFTPPEQKERTPNPPVVTCSSTEPEKYLGQYLAAVSMGSQFKVSPEQAKEFAQNMEASINEKVGVSQKTGNDVTDPFKLSRISNAASGYCKQFMSELKQELKKQNQFQNPEQEQKQEHKQSRGR